MYYVYGIASPLMNTAAPPIKLLIAEDQELTRSGYIKMLKNSGFNLEFIGEGSNGRDIIDLLNSGVVPDIILTDIEMPVMSGFALIDYVKKNFPGIKLIALSMYGGDYFVASAIVKGACAFLTKNTALAEMVETIKAVYEGKYHFNENVSKSVLKILITEKSFLSNIELTERETEILRLICHGSKNKAIAEKLSISEETVKSHRKSIYKKTDAVDILDLFKYALRKGIIDVYDEDSGQSTV